MIEGKSNSLFQMSVNPYMSPSKVEEHWIKLWLGQNTDLFKIGQKLIVTVQKNTLDLKMSKG